MARVEEAPPVPVAIVVDEAHALEKAEAKRRRDQAVGFAAMAIVGAPVVGFLARIVYEWAELGWGVL